MRLCSSPDTTIKQITVLLGIRLRHCLHRSLHRKALGDRLRGGGPKLVGMGGILQDSPGVACE